jgi:hypothetical protein
MYTHNVHVCVCIIHVCVHGREGESERRERGGGENKRRGKRTG